MAAWDGEVERYVRTGTADDMASVWPGNTYVDCALFAHAELRAGLLREVRARAAGRAPPGVPDLDLEAFTRARVEPMVRGLFPRAEHDVVLAVLERSVVFLTAETIEAVLTTHTWNRSAWELANLYLGSLGADPLGDAPAILGSSEGTTCYVTARYFAEQDPFDDFLVHEAAHVFHNCKRATVGLRSTRRKEWLLDIAYAKRETFAYSCEVLARVVERSASADERRRLALEYRDLGRLIGDDRVDSDEVADIVVEASKARNGWKVILGRCAASRSRSPHVTDPGALGVDPQPSAASSRSSR